MGKATKLLGLGVFLIFLWICAFSFPDAEYEVPVIQLEENNFLVGIVLALEAATKLTCHGKHCIEKGTGFVSLF